MIVRYSLRKNPAHWNDRDFHSHYSFKGPCGPFSYGNRLGGENARNLSRLAKEFVDELGACLRSVFSDGSVRYIVK